MLPLLTLANERLSQEQVVRAISEGWGGRRDSVWLLLPFVLTLLALLGWLFIRKRRDVTRDEHPLALFSSLAGQLGIGLRDRWLLMRIARRQSLPTPLALLMCPRTLHQNARAFAGRLSTGRRRRVLRSVSRIRRALVAG